MLVSSYPDFRDLLIHFVVKQVAMQVPGDHLHFLFAMNLASLNDIHPPSPTLVLRLLCGRWCEYCRRDTPQRLYLHFGRYLCPDCRHDLIGYTKDYLGELIGLLPQRANQFVSLPLDQYDLEHGTGDDFVHLELHDDW